MTSAKSMELRSLERVKLELSREQQQLKSQNPGRSPDKQDSRGHKCESCEKSFQNKYSLLIHKRTHTGEKPYKCSSCPSRFSQKSDMTIHSRTHRGEKLFKCEYCPRGFPCSSQLTAHRRIHTGEKPYECKSCPRKFTHKSSLVDHTRTHTGEKPYSCEYCQRAFAYSSLLRKHRRTHTGERPFKCGFCEYSAANSNTLQRHEWTHTGERPYKCGSCNFSATRRYDLKRHEKLCLERWSTGGLSHNTRPSVQAVPSVEEHRFQPRCSKVDSSTSRLNSLEKTHRREEEEEEEGMISVIDGCSAVQGANDAFVQEEQWHANKTCGISVQIDDFPTTAKGQDYYSGTHQGPSSSESAGSQCPVCELFSGSEATIASHMNAVHKLPVVALRRLRFRVIPTGAPPVGHVSWALSV